MAEKAAQRFRIPFNAGVYRGCGRHKTALQARMRLEIPAAGYLHMPADRDLDWYQGVTSKRPIRRSVKGVPHIEWAKDSGVRDEPLDCHVYATAALNGLYAAGFKFAALAE